MERRLDAPETDLLKPSLLQRLVVGCWPVLLCALDPELTGAGAAAKIAASSAFARHLFERKPHRLACQAEGMAQSAGRWPALGLREEELRDMGPGSLLCDREPLDGVKNLRLGLREPDIEPTARHRAVLRHQNRAGNKVGTFRAQGADRLSRPLPH